MSEETKHKILIVEDDEMVRSFVTIHLENNGFDVSGVATGKAFFAAMENEPVDLIILDLNLPDGDGLEFAAEFRKTDNTPIIIASARKGMDDRLTALNMGSIDYVTKPFDPQELFLRIRNLLNIVSPDNDQSSVESVPEPPAKNYLAIGTVVALLTIVIAGAGWYMGQSSVPKVADDGAANKNLLANQQPPPAPPVVQKPAQNLAQKQPVQIEPPKATVEPKQIAKTPPTAPKPKVVQKCDRLPDVEWWRNKNHLSIRAYVQRKYAGDWVPYIKSWNRRLDKLVDIQKRESSAVASSGVVIAGKDLEEYIEKVEKRITVLKCLAGNKTSS